MNYFQKSEDFLIEKKKQKSYTYGCVMLFLDFPEMENIHKKIKQEDLYTEEKGFGIEKDSHTTLLYGLHHDELTREDEEKIFTIVSKFDLDKIKLYNVSLFENDKYDVLKFDVKSDDNILNKINKKLTKQFPYSNDYPDYHPHCTIAYIKSGKGKYYVDKFKDKEFTLKGTKIVYSKPFKNGDNKLTTEFNI